MARVAIAYLTDGEAGSPDAERAPANEDIQVAAGGLQVVAVTRDHGRARSGLVEALERLAAGEATMLLSARLGALARSLRELVALLDWLAAGELELVALDVGLDTGSRAGRRTVALLREIDSWEREPRPGRAPRGRPGMAVHAPELSDRIAAMRARGLSLQAIADLLDAEGVPTPRGGARWRPSSVQAALGYRRPQPPVPGAPPPPPPPPDQGPRAPGRPAGSPDHGPRAPGRPTGPPGPDPPPHGRARGREGPAR